MTLTDTHQQYAAAARYRLVSTDFGQPLLLLHGLGGSRGQLMQYLSRPDASTVLAPDLRGHGETELIGAPGDFSFDGLTDDVVALLDALRYPPAAVIGVSMGAGVAVNLALRYPRRVRAMLLIRPAWLDAPGDPLHPVEIAEVWAGQISGCRWEQTRSRDSDRVGYHADLAAAVERFVGTLDVHPFVDRAKG